MPQNDTFPQSVRMKWAAMVGGAPGHHFDVACTYCGIVGELWWQDQPRSPFRHPGVYVHPSNWGGVYIEFDHVDPGGGHELANLAPACSTCNSSKSNRTIDEWLAVLAHTSRHPRRADILERLAVA